MKVLHIISQTPDFTGSGKYVLEMVAQSKKMGNENYLVAGTCTEFCLPEDILAPNRCRFVRFGQDLDFPIVGMSDVMPYPSTVCSCLTPEQIDRYKAAFLREIKAAIERFAPDIIHTNHLWMVSAVTREAAPHIPIVTTCHGTCLRQHQLCPELGNSLVPTLSNIDRVIALFEDQKQDIHTLLNIPKSKVDVISGGFKKDCFYSNERKSPSETVQILYAGKLNASKGVPLLLKSLIRIKELPFHLHMVGGGSGPEKERCLELAGELGNKVTVHGILTHEKLANLMRASHIFVLPSFFEGMPLVLLEALACGCRIVTTDLPGCKQLFNPPHPEMVRLLELPELMTIDRPHPKDLPMLEEKLSGLLLESIEDVTSGISVDDAYVKEITDPYTWVKIYNRVEKAYRQAISDRS